MGTEKKGLSAINYTIIMSQGWKKLVHINPNKRIKYAISLTVFSSVLQLKHSTFLHMCVLTSKLISCFTSYKSSHLMK